MDKGTSTSIVNSSIARFIVSPGSTPVTPMLTSNTSAPASTWAKASFFTIKKLPLRISSANTLRPVGLIRSPMMIGFSCKPTFTTLVRLVKAVNGSTCGRSAGVCARAALAIDSMCFGVLPQQAPKYVAPASRKRGAYSPISSGPNGKIVSFPTSCGIPAFG